MKFRLSLNHCWNWMIATICIFFRFIFDLKMPYVSGLLDPEPEPEAKVADEKSQKIKDFCEKISKTLSYSELGYGRLDDLRYDVLWVENKNKFLFIYVLNN